MAQSTVTVKVRGVPLEVDFAYNPPSKGHRDSFGAPEEPDEPAEIDIEEIRCGEWEILSIMDDASISKARAEILAGRYT